jgi:hypothetical protein
MNESAAKEQIVRTIIEVLLGLEPPDQAVPQIYQILMQENFLDLATARLLIKNVLSDHGYTVDYERVDLCFFTFQGLTNGLERWFRETSEDYKEQFPAWELTKVMQEVEVVNWKDRWQNCGGKIYAGDRMAALIDDPIWLKISDFGFPFPPFALNSGMGWQAVSHEEFLDLGGQLPEDTRPKIPRSKQDLEILEALISKIDSGELKFRVKAEIVKDEQDKKSPKPSEANFGSGKVELNQNRFDMDLLKELKRSLESGESSFNVQVEFIKDGKQNGKNPKGS